MAKVTITLPELTVPSVVAPCQLLSSVQSLTKEDLPSLISSCEDFELLSPYVLSNDDTLLNASVHLLLYLAASQLIRAKQLVFRLQNSFSILPNSVLSTVFILVDSVSSFNFKQFYTICFHLCSDENLAKIINFVLNAFRSELLSLLSQTFSKISIPLFCDLMCLQHDNIDVFLSSIGWLREEELVIAPEQSSDCTVLKSLESFEQMVANLYNIL
ncbi:hypothetical protein RCL1_007910 [Eukaryota sp. TZLM3-RCL]